jgi:hypothetical protein
MSRNKKLILAGLAVLDVACLCVIAGVILYTTLPLMNASSFSASVPTPSRLPTKTPFPTWTPKPTYISIPTRTPRSTRTPAATATETVTPGPTFTPTPTGTPTPTPKPLENPTFDDLGMNNIPGWQTGAFVNWVPGDEFNPGTSFATPRFHPADNPVQRINGSTLQIDTEPWVKLRAWVFQSVDVGPGSRVVFEVRAAAVVKDTAGGYFLKAGVDPNGGEGCDGAEWGSVRQINQGDAVVVLSSPQVVVGEEGRVTLCMFAETQYAQAWHAAFFDDAALTVLPPE